MNARQICDRLGGDVHTGYFNAPCPICQPERRREQRALSIREDGGNLLLHCFKSGCGFGDICKALGVNGPFAKGREPSAYNSSLRQQDEAKRLQCALDIWHASKPITDTRGERYLRGRGITCDLPKSLRWHPRCFHKPTNVYRGAIVAQVGTRGAIHRTFLGSDGARLRERAKLMLGPCQGAAVHLAEGCGPLVICEGIETGLSLASGLLDGSPRVWAALSASGLKAIDLPAVPGETYRCPG